MACDFGKWCFHSVCVCVYRQSPFSSESISGTGANNAALQPGGLGIWPIERLPPSGKVTSLLLCWNEDKLISYPKTYHTLDAQTSRDSLLLHFVYCSSLNLHDRGHYKKYNCHNRKACTFNSNGMKELRHRLLSKHVRWIPKYIIT